MCRSMCKGVLKHENRVDCYQHGHMHNMVIRISLFVLKCHQVLSTVYASEKESDQAN